MRPSPGLRAPPIHFPSVPPSRSSLWRTCSVPAPVPGSCSSPGSLVGTQANLKSFHRFLYANLNRQPALLVVQQRPRDLTRQQLKALKLALDQAGYSELALQAAWRNLTNQDIAASIIGFVRQQALGSPLRPYQERVDAALKRILAGKAWTVPQRKWLERIGKQMKQEIVVDREALDRGQFEAEGGFARLNKIFEGQLEQVLADLNETAWQDAG